MNCGLPHPSSADDLVAVLPARAVFLGGGGVPGVPAHPAPPAVVLELQGHPTTEHLRIVGQQNIGFKSTSKLGLSASHLIVVVVDGVDEPEPPH